MISSYRDRRTESFARGDFVSAFQGFADQAGRRLAILHAATSLDDLRGLRGNRLEALGGDRQGQYSIRINNRRRICFEWSGGAPGPANVEITDYHQRRETTMLQHAAHPGEVLKEELDELGITPTELARQIAVPANRMSQIINGKRSITGDTALRLGHWFRTDPQFWMNLQTQFELVTARKAAGESIQALPTRSAPAPETEQPSLA